MQKHLTVLSFIAILVVFFGSLFTFLLIAEGQDLRGQEPWAMEFVTAAKSNSAVEVFVTSWCPYCKKLEALLQSQNIPYTRYDIEADSKGERLYRSLGGGGVPIVRIGSFVVRGFHPDLIMRTLGYQSGSGPGESF